MKTSSRFILISALAVVIIPVMGNYIDTLFKIIPLHWDLLTGAVFGVILGILYFKANRRISWWLVVLVILLTAAYELRWYGHFLDDKAHIMDTDISKPVKELIFNSTYGKYRMLEINLDRKQPLPPTFLNLLNLWPQYVLFLTKWILPFVISFFFYKMKNKKTINKNPDLLDQ